MPESQNAKPTEAARLAENLRHIADSLSDPNDAPLLRDYAAELEAACHKRDRQANHVSSASNQVTFRSTARQPGVR